MITPAFDLSQNPEYLILSVRVPYTRTSEFDLYIDGTDVKFYAKPYFLRLTLPGRVVEDGREKASFDIDKGLFTVQIPKEIAGEHFEGLQMLTSLLAPRGSRSAKPLLQDINPDCSESVDNEEAQDEEDFDWQVEQEVYVERSEEGLSDLQKYGFGNQRYGVFARLQEELSDVIDVKNPDRTTIAERRQARMHAEASAFSPDHYLADLFEDAEIKRLLKFRSWWTKLCHSPEQEEEPGGVTVDNQKTQWDALLVGGRACILKCLLDIHKVFRQNDPAYILNDLYITDYCIWIQRLKSKKLSALAAALQKVSLQKKDLDLDIEELEEAATMVVEEEDGASKSASEYHTSSHSGDSSSSEEDDESEVEGQAHAESGGGESSKDSPLNPQHTSAVCVSIQQERALTILSAESKVDTLPQAPEGARPLIQELGELRISQEFNGSPKAERKCSQQSVVSSGGSSSGSLLESSPHRNPLLIVQKQEDPHTQDVIS
ncbi:protein SHQ1 homolog isoform X3 [Phyllopteryx taeniolatus]|uniref:protein SHQ1 homolog isoform X3 n=1 Tax=Phyllopteryx taeniolatus TaxID=161469 RepID=UPI002AD2795A|nr:protein SHQ1 homolog isoform X3 [Phyllopteryx taeniolatus]